MPKKSKEFINKKRYTFTIDVELKNQFEEEVFFNDTKMSTVLGALIEGYVNYSRAQRKELESKIG